MFFVCSFTWWSMWHLFPSTVSSISGGMYRSQSWWTRSSNALLWRMTVSNQQIVHSQSLHLLTHRWPPPPSFFPSLSLFPSPCPSLCLIRICCVPHLHCSGWCWSGGVGTIRGSGERGSSHDQCHWRDHPPGPSSTATTDWENGRGIYLCLCERKV